ncbi:Fe(3+) ABC transporter substrate-binding protein [Microcoleus sp. FACHB-1515]|uniref:Fe(3+) ABC transporter substrate-binding protein n=1 Tax=Cyanophyceae TaxID=3028117 RepID=UPI001689EE2A|nr:Fe(3+) ABC transporter substrate-binding protein [Microcoleus sp. FACHB-1515]MBD2088378.1 Fe(3+) ABC transporter substrate-binding protein [Microcoleus sp. FACHB-1515]
MKRISAVAIGFALLLATGCQTAQNAEGESDVREVNVYSSRHYDSDDEIYQEFTESTGIRVNLIEGKDDELIERIQTEGTNSPADVLITVDAGRLWRAEQAKVLQPVQSETLEAAIPNNFQHPDNLWFGLTQRARVIAYNKAQVQPSELSTYEALAEPQWQGQVCIRSSTNIYNQSLLGSIIETVGADKAEAWATGLVNNLAREPEGGDVDQIKAVAAGECKVAIVNHYYWARMMASDDAEDREVAEKVGLFFPNQTDRGTHVNISGAGVVYDAPNREHAIAFLEFLASPEAQEVFAKGSYEFPVVEGVETDAIVEGLGDFKADAVNVSALGRNNPAAVEIADRAQWK